MLEILGKVIINVLDADTLELLNTIEQDNVITKRFYNDWISNTYGGLATSIFISTSTSPSSEDWCTVSNCITDGFIPSGVTSPLYFAPVGIIPAYMQFMRRFNAPVTNRSISTVLLTKGEAATFSCYTTVAYVNFSAPCIQTTSQILDVYYRIQVNNSLTGSYNFYPPDPSRTLKSLLLSDGDTTHTIPYTGYLCPTYANVTSASNNTPTNTGALFNVFSKGKAIGVDSSVIVTKNGYYGCTSLSWSYTTSQGVGNLHGAISVYTFNSNWDIKKAYTTINVTAPNGSKIQPIFSHSASTLTSTTANPFLDSLPSSGTGTLNLGGTWSVGNLPELYKVNIVTEGNVGTATYTFAKRNHFGFLGVSYNSDIAGLPGAYNYYNYNINKPHTCGNGNINNVNQYSNRIEKYDSTHFISYDQTGVSRYNCTNHYTEIWDSTTTPALNATNIRQAAVNPGDGTIWVACADTGIYKISANGAIITKYTTANGLPTNNCYALDIGRNNAVWALCGGGVVTSADAGTTWTIYNATTTPAFNSTAITGDWSSVNYMRVDPTHVNDRMCFVRKENATLYNATGYVWWDCGTGVTVNSTLNFTLYTNDVNARRIPSMFNVSDNDGLWIIQTNSPNNGAYNVNKLVYGTSTFSSSAAFTTYSNTALSVMFVRNSTNTQDVILNIGHNGAGASYNSTLVGVSGSGYTPTIMLTDSTLTITYITQPTTIGGSGTIDNTTNCVYLDNGIIAGYTRTVYQQYGFQQDGYNGVIYAISGNGTPSGGTAVEHLIWQKYGWDGTNWVLGNTNPKTTHADEQLLIHGITARFTNGISGTSFITDDYYTGSVNDGILKNNAMTMTGSSSFYVIPTEYLTDFDGIIRLYPWTTGTVSWRKVSSSITVNNDNSLTNNIIYRSYAMNAGSKNRVFGNFSISGTFTADTKHRYAVGIKTVNMSESPNLRENQYNDWGFVMNGGNNVYVTNGSGTFLTSNITISNTTTWNITRVGNTITFYIGAVSRYSTSNASYSFIINARFTDGTYGDYPFTINPITVDSSESGYYVGLGNSGTGTGIYNTKQLLATIVNISDVSINGTPLTVLDQTPVNIPASGGAALAPEEGLLFFNSADVGKTVTGSYIMNYQVSTPCNIIPV